MPIKMPYIVFNKIAIFAEERSQLPKTVVITLTPGQLHLPVLALQRGHLHLAVLRLLLHQELRRHLSQHHVHDLQGKR
jgi:molybdopterin-guanine dinucleotide biosynthesis protein A